MEILTDLGSKILSIFEAIAGMDFMSETTGRTNYNSKIVESTHVFVCDYVDIDKSEIELTAYHNNKQYEITYIDDPMGLHYHLEIFLKYIGD